MDLSTNQKGEIAQLKIQMRAVEKGWIVSKTSEGSRYDLVLDNGERLYRCQVKWIDVDSVHSDGAVQVGLRKYQGNDRNKAAALRRKTKTYEEGEVDALLLYIPRVEAVCWIPPQVFIGRGTIQLRYKQPKNGQIHGIRMVSDFLW